MSTTRWDSEGFTLGPITLTIPAGQTLALVGRTGSGKTTLTKVLSRAVEPPAGTAFLDGVDLTSLDLDHLRATVGVVGQRTEILAATLRDNLTLYQDVPAERIDAAIDALGLGTWVASLPDGLDTVLGPNGRRLSAGEEQLVAFARLLVRDVHVVILDEATARMDAFTSHTVTEAARRLLAGRTAIVVAHRLATARHADAVAVLHEGKVVEHGSWQGLAASGGRLTALVAADGSRSVHENDTPADLGGGVHPEAGRPDSEAEPTVVSRGTPSGTMRPLTLREFWHHVVATATARPKWWVTSEIAWWLPDLIGTGGMLTAVVWAAVITGLEDGHTPWLAAALFTAAGLFVPLLTLMSSRPATLWHSESNLRLRLAVLRGQLRHGRGEGPAVRRGSSGEITARAMEGWRLVGYANQGRDLVIGLLNVVIMAAISRPWLAVGIGAVIVAGYVASSLVGRRMLRRTAQRARDTRAGFFRDLGSVLESVRTIKLSGATGAALTRLRALDRERIVQSVREDRAEFVVSEFRTVLSQAATLTVWALLVAGFWPLSTTLVVLAALGTFSWVGWAAAGQIGKVPTARDWIDEARHLAGTADLTMIPSDVDLVTGTHEGGADAVNAPPLRELRLRDVRAVHHDGTVGVRDVDLTVGEGEMVAVVGVVGAGKSSLLAGLAGLTRLDGDVSWNGVPVPGLEGFAGTRVAYVAQVPRVVSGSIAENVHLDHDRDVAAALRTAQLADDVTAADGPETLVGHRGLRLSGGQTQRLALARALAAKADLLVLDDVSSALDAATEADLWEALAASRASIVATSSRHATLARADRVVVLDRGRQVASGTWAELRARWGHLAG